MSDLLPILRNKDPRMALCEICPDPGHCCREFVIYGRMFWLDQSKESVTEEIRNLGFPFEAVSPSRESGTWKVHDREYGHWSFTCPELLEGGACGIYEDRPECCRDYVPGIERLCVFGEYAGMGGKCDSPSSSPGA